MANTLKGTIEGSYLPDIFQLACTPNSPAGFFQFANGPHRVIVHVAEGGLITHAMSTNNATGMDAIDELAVWTEGTYSFTPTDKLQPSTINKPTSSVLRSLALQIDEWRVLSRVIESIYMFPYPNTFPGQRPDMNSREKRIMELANGHYSVEEIALLLGQPLNALAKTLHGLITKEFLVLKAVRYAHPPAAALEIKGGPSVRRRSASHSVEHSGVHEASGLFRLPSASPSGEASEAPSPVPSHQEPAPEVQTTTTGTGGQAQVGDYMAFANSIFETAQACFPEKMHKDLVALFQEARNKILFDGGTNIQTLKILAVAINKLGKAHAEANECSREALFAYNEAVKKLFGK